VKQSKKAKGAQTEIRKRETPKVSPAQIGELGFDERKLSPISNA